MGNTGKYYRFGEPTIGHIHSAFRSKKDLEVFLKVMGEKNLVDIFEIQGEIVSDEDGPDGLYVFVETYRKTKIRS